MKTLLLFTCALLALSVEAASPLFNQFDTNYFNTDPVAGYVQANTNASNPKALATKGDLSTKAPTNSPTLYTPTVIGGETNTGPSQALAFVGDGAQLTNINLAANPYLLNVAIGCWNIGNYTLDETSMNDTASLGGYTNFNYEIHKLVPTNIFPNPAGIRLVFSNPGIHVVTPGPITLRASWKNPDGSFVPAYFNGNRDVIIPVGGRVESDLMLVNVASNIVACRVFGRVPPGTACDLNEVIDEYQCPWNPANCASTIGGGGTLGNGLSDQTTSGTIPDSIQWGYGPDAILSEVPSGQISIGIIGDSYMSALAGNTNMGGSFHNTLWQWAVSNNFPVVNCSSSGSSTTDAATNLLNMDAVLRSCSHVLIEVSINDKLFSHTFAAVSNNVMSMVSRYSSAGKKVYLATTPPFSSSTDGFLTTGNQTALQLSLHTNYNNWVRSMPSGVAGIFDIAPLLESSTNSGIWKADGTTAGKTTTDGIHPATALSQGIYISALRAWLASLSQSAGTVAIFSGQSSGLTGSGIPASVVLTNFDTRSPTVASSLSVVGSGAILSINGNLLSDGPFKLDTTVSDILSFISPTSGNALSIDDNSQTIYLGDGWIIGGNGANLTSLNASQLLNGTVPFRALPTSVITNNYAGTVTANAFAGDASNLTNTLTVIGPSAATNFTATFNGRRTIINVTNGPDVFIGYAGWGGDVSFRFKTNVTIHFTYQPTWLTGSNSVVTNGVLSLTAYGSTNVADIVAAMKEKQ